MSLGCARCGDCCDPVHLDLEQRIKIDMAHRRAVDEPDYVYSNSSVPFILEHWSQLQVREDGGATYACDQFDPHTRRCTAPDRPPVCRDFPVYSDEKLDASRMGPGSRCSYLLDVPPSDRPEGSRPLIPLFAKGDL